MARELTVGAAAALDANPMRPLIFYEGEFASGFLRLFSGMGSVPWDGKTWIGAGSLMGISEITETSKINANGLTASLSGMPSSLISTVHTYARHGKPGKVWLGFLDSAGAIIADPYLAFEGRLDVPAIEDSGDTCTISVQYESRLVDLQRPRVWRYDDQSQRALYPNDGGFRYVADLQNQELAW